MILRKTSFVLYHDIRVPLELLSDEDRGKLFLALLNYSEFSEVPAFSGALQMAFAFIQAALDRDAAKWSETREKRREAGSKGGKQRVANQANACTSSEVQANEASQAVPVPVSVPVSGEELSRPSAFDRFWSAYPRKVGKGDARKAFDKAVKKGVSVETLISAVEAQKNSRQWAEDGGKYIPNPATWINQGRWEDELEPAHARSEEEPFDPGLTEEEFQELVYGRRSGHDPVC